MKVRIIAIIYLFIFFMLPSNSAFAANTRDSQKISVYFFWGEGCGQCKEQKALLSDLKNAYPQLEINSYETFNSVENAELFSRIAKAYRLGQPVVPCVFIDDESWVGYNNSYPQEIKDKVRYCLKNKCFDPLTKMISSVLLSEESPTASEKPKTVTLPFFGSLDPSKVSLPVFTILIGGFDAFNPCAFFVLLILLSLLVRTGSRKRILLVGGIFVFFSGLIYFLFMAAWLNLFLLLGHLKIITSIAGTVAVIIALINIKDFFFFKKGVSLTISEQAKPKLFERMRGVINKGSLTSLIFATIALGVMANIYELFCTPGFPLIYTRVLTLEKLPLLQYYLFLILYNVIYVIPLMLIVLVLGFTLGQKKMTESQGQTLKLVSGLMMLFLGFILVIKPSFLDNIFIAAGLLITAILTSGVIIFIHRFFVKETP